MKSKLFLILFVLVAAVILFSEPAIAQCPMCAASAETSLKEGSTQALGLNTGILYLLAFPYVLCGTLFLLWYRNVRKNRLTAN